MFPTDDFPKLRFLCGFDDRDADEALARGYRSHVFAVLENGDAFPVSFYDPVRLTQDLQSSIDCGIPYVAEAGLIVIPEITLANMQQAVTRLYKEGFFEAFKPVEPEAANKAVNPSGDLAGF